ncbi:MAG: CopG family antitoxin [Gammaproteobacteria bacterium]
MTKRKQPIFNLDAEEQELSDSFDRDEWKSVPNLDAEKAKARKAAANYFRKEARINIRISEIDLEHIKQKAAYEGLPYQTLIASILHKFAAGHL